MVKQEEKKLIGYNCSYIPVELLAATGYKPYRLLHGDSRLSGSGEKLLRVDACPLVKSNLSYIIENKDKFAAVVGSTGCDMARRMFDCLRQYQDVLSAPSSFPIYVLNNPRTDKPEIFYDEIDWLVKELEHLSNKNFSPDLINYEIERWEAARNRYRVFAQKRAVKPSLISTTAFAKACANFHKGDIELEIKIDETLSQNPRVYLLGSAIPYEAHLIIEMLEANMRIVGDFNCGISRFLNINIKEKNLDGIKKAYYNQIPCIYKRPNNQFYEMVGAQIKQLACKGIIAWTLDYCDNYEFELKRIERIFGLPVLRIRSDLSFQNINQLKTRIGAFAEMLA
jgi:benzoyl-CoA reductase/2-hydroxyglutaryl-CoA dehydratase subunit BcrC/BadD/HgdB